jgi:hypothetical protein
VGAFERKSGRAQAAWLMVIGSHTLLIYWMVRNDEVVLPTEVSPIASLELTWIPLAVPLPGTPGAESPPRQEAPRRQAPDHHSIDAPAPLPDVVSVPTAPPSPDWHSAAERAAQRAITADPNKTRDFTSTPASPYRDCERKVNNFEWKPDAHRTGWANGLPYVRAGKRCVIGLGFFGCHLDPELPPPDGELFEDMNTANQMDGTVPGAQDCVMPAPTQPARQR